MQALRVARELCTQLGLRLVIAHVARSYRVVDSAEGLTNVKARQGASRLLEEIVRDQGLDSDVDRRAEVGDPAQRLASIAAEEGADLIVVGSRRQGRRRVKLVSGLAGELSAATSRPVVVVPPLRR
jgi:nucleotide-binding universal stress UspA family protein